MPNGVFSLTLDTTGPQLQVTLPKYSAPGLDTEVWVIGSEQLAPDQTFYLVDSLGARHDLIFRHDGDRFYGLVNFAGFPYGIAKLFAQAWDDVGNPSPLVEKALLLVKPAPAEMTAAIKARLVLARDKGRRVPVQWVARLLSAAGAVRAIRTADGARKIVVKYKVRTVKGWAK